MIEELKEFITDKKLEVITEYLNNVNYDDYGWNQAKSQQISRYDEILNKIEELEYKRIASDKQTINECFEEGGE